MNKELPDTGLWDDWGTLMEDLITDLANNSDFGAHVKNWDFMTWYETDSGGRFPYCSWFGDEDQWEECYNLAADVFDLTKDAIDNLGTDYSDTFAMAEFGAGWCDRGRQFPQKVIDTLQNDFGTEYFRNHCCKNFEIGHRVNMDQVVFKDQMPPSKKTC